MDTFDVTCPKCGTSAHLSVPTGLEVHPFPCPGCGFVLDPEDGYHGRPMPQHDTSKSPSPQAKIYRFMRRGQ